MSVFSKLFDDLLRKSSNMQDIEKRSQKLEERIATLEKQINILANTTRTLAETVTQLVQSNATNRQAIEEVYNFVTNPEPDFSDHEDQEDSMLSEESIEKYKKLLN